MRFVILHESSSRIRVRVPKYNMTMEQADILEYYLRNKPFVVQATVHDRTSDASIRYRGGAEGRKALLEALRGFSFSGSKRSNFGTPRKSIDCRISSTGIGPLASTLSLSRTV